MGTRNPPGGSLNRRSILKAIGTMTAGAGTLAGTSRSAAVRESPPPTPTPVRQYVGDVSGTLRYAGGGAGADRDRQDTSFTHSVQVTVIDQSRRGGPPALNPIEIVLSTTPEVTEPQEGDINVVTGFVDEWGGQVIDYTSHWTVHHDPNTGETLASKLPTGPSVNLIWVWWFGISGAVVSQQIVPPSTFAGTITDQAVNLRLSLGDSGPGHVLRGYLSATRLS